VAKKPIGGDICPAEAFFGGMPERVFADLVFLVGDQFREHFSSHYIRFLVLILFGKLFYLG
jgi:hypothetical protein